MAPLSWRADTSGSISTRSATTSQVSEASQAAVLDEGFTILHDPAGAEVDIIFVHGLGGHPYSTWACKRKTSRVTKAVANSTPQSNNRRSFFDRIRSREADAYDEPVSAAPALTESSSEDIYWPRDFLKEEIYCKKARILVYGYDSKVSKGYANANKNSLFSHARGLLYAVQRQKPARRSVIFVAHSLGGLLVKEVLRRSDASEESELQDIVKSTKGIIFLGTPHRGSSDMANLGELVRKIASFALRVDSNGTIIRALETNSPELELGRESFPVLWREHDFRVKSFQEAWGVKGINVGALNEKIVPDISSTLDDPREHLESISANHMDMCRFPAVTDAGYRNIASELGTMIGSLSKNLHMCEDGRVFLRSLYFEGMYDRRHNIQKALDDTCDWLYSTSEYKDWIGQSSISADKRLLWIKGKPGAGKSTLMKDALRRAEVKYSNSQTTTAGFFFNARSTQTLEKTPIGLYRSLLHQVLQQDVLALSYLIPRFKLETSIRGTISWHQEEVQDILTEVFATSESRPAVIFIDAMDECNDDEVRDLVHFCRSLTKKAHQAGASLTICLSSRHYPQISIDGCPTLVVEQYNHEDILRYIVWESEGDEAIKNLKDDIFEKSSGVFLWVVLVVAILKKQCRGKSTKWLRQKLVEIPPELHTLFRSLFTDRGSLEVRQATCLMQLVLFAEEPLTLTKLHIAIAFGAHDFKSIAQWRDSVDYLETAKQRHEMIIELSRGLLEEAPSSLNLPKTNEKEFGKSSYQFIHETVREFFLSGEGFMLLQSSTASVQGEGHSTIAAACAHYLDATEFENLASNDVSHHSDYALIDYVARSMFNHIDKAEEHGVSQEGTLGLLGRQNCRLLGRLVQYRPMDRRLVSGTTLLLAAITSGTIHAARRIISMGHSVNEYSMTSFQYPLHAAVAGRPNSSFAIPNAPQPEMVELLLSSGASVTLRNRSKQTPLHVAATTVAQVVELVLAHKPSIDAQDMDGETALHRAHLSYSEYVEITDLLVRHNANVSITDHQGRTPETIAEEFGQRKNVTPGLSILMKDQSDRLLEILRRGRRTGVA